MEIESLVISIGVDIDKLNEGLSRVQAMLDRFVSNVEQLTGGFAQGFRAASENVDGTTRATDAAARKMTVLGDSATDASGKARTALRQLQTETDKTGQQAENTGKRLRDMGQSLGTAIGSLSAKLAGPLAMAIGLGKKMFGDYMGGIAQVASMTGAYTGQLEEYRKKTALLQRVTREDIDLFRKSRLAMNSFQIALDDVSHSIMQSLSPVIRKGIELLGKVTEWVQRNEPNIKRFVLVLAATITGVLIPSFIKLGATMLANPVTLIMAAIMGLALVLDDLVTYIQGGETALGSFWAMFGTGEEIAAALADAWEYLQDVGLALWGGLKAAAQVFWGYFGGVFPPIMSALAAAIKMIAALFRGDFAGAFEQAGNLIESVLNGIAALFTGVANAIAGAVGSIAGVIGNLFRSAGNSTLSFSDALSAVTAVVSGLGNGLENLAGTVAGAFGRLVDSAASTAGSLLGVFSPVTDGITGIFSSAADAVKTVWDAVVDWFAAIPSRILAALGNIGTAVKEKVMGPLGRLGRVFGIGSNDNEEQAAQPVAPTAAPGAQILNNAATVIPSREQLEQAGASGRNTTNNNRSVRVDSTINATINTQATDAEGIARELGPALNKQVSSVYAADGGVAL